MSELKTQLRRAAGAYRQVRYPGDLAADLSAELGDAAAVAPVASAEAASAPAMRLAAAPRARRPARGLRRFVLMGALGASSAVAAATALVLWSRVSMLPLNEPGRVLEHVAGGKLPDFRVPPLPGLPRQLS